jgi:hypothetical protein
MWWLVPIVGYMMPESDELGAQAHALVERVFAMLGECHGSYPISRLHPRDSNLT